MLSLSFHRLFFWTPLRAVRGVGVFLLVFLGLKGVYYGQGTNFKFGKLEFDLTGTFSATYNSNVLSLNTPLPDVIFTPGLNLSANYQFSKYSNLSIALGLGYQFYMRNRELDSSNNFINIAPNSNIQFAVQFGNLTALLYCNVNYQTDTTEVLTSAGNNTYGVTPGTYGRFNTVTGVNVVWDLNRVQVGVNVNQARVIPFGANSQQFEFTNSTTYTTAPYISAAITPTIVVGVQGSVAYNSYKVNFQNSSTAYSYGPFVNWQVLSNLSLSTSVSKTIYLFEQTGHNGDTSNTAGATWQGTLLHTWTERFQHRLFTTHSYQYGYISNTTSVHLYGWSWTWDIARQVTLRGALVYSTGQDSGGYSPQTYSTWTWALGATKALSRRLTANLDYIYTSNFDSSDGELSYKQTQLILSLSYDF